MAGSQQTCGRPGRATVAKGDICRPARGRHGGEPPRAMPGTTARAPPRGPALHGARGPAGPGAGGGAVSANKLKSKYVALRDRSDELEGAVSDAILELRRQLKLGHDARRRAARARLDDAAKNWRAAVEERNRARDEWRRALD